MKRKNSVAQKPKDLVIKPGDYQPTRKELDEKQDMPGMSDKQVRKSFFQLFNFVKKED